MKNISVPALIFRHLVAMLFIVALSAMDLIPCTVAIIFHLVNYITVNVLLLLKFRLLK